MGLPMTPITNNMAAYMMAGTSSAAFCLLMDIKASKSRSEFSDEKFASTDAFVDGFILSATPTIA